MASNYGVTYIPVKEIVRDVEIWWSAQQDEIANAMLKKLRQNIDRKTKRKTGNLRKSVRKRRSKTDKNVIMAGAWAPHAHLIEMGHRLTTPPRGKGKVIGHVAPKSFFRPAEDELKAELAELIDDITIEVKR